jgi:outer membrane protein OmpA-like peptidoglycan-associated protein
MNPHRSLPAALLASVAAGMGAVACAQPAATRPAPDLTAVVTSDGEQGWWTLELVGQDGTIEPLGPDQPPTAAPTVIRIPSDLLFFATDSSDVGDEGRHALSAVVQQVVISAVPVVVTGHTDDVGPDDYNQALAADRARAVRQVLVELGVPADLLVEGVSRGESCPLASNADPRGRARNRRVELGPGTADQACQPVALTEVEGR